MIVALAFCDNDMANAIDVLGWMRELDGQHTRHQCVLVGSKGMNRDKLDAVHAAARGAFQTVHFIQPFMPDERGWPMSCNTLFKAAASYIEQTLNLPWFWNEPDCIPLKPAWLDALEADYLGCRKPFMGTMFSKPWPHITGTAVYPPSVRRHSQKMALASIKPWDVIDAVEIIRKAHQTQLIQHSWGDVATNTPPTFPNLESLKQIRPQAVVFHRCKDGSLIKRLRERSGRRHYDESGRLNNCIVQLGRYGDIMNVLPIARHIAKSYAPPYFMVSRDFMDVLDGVGYVKPEIFDGPYTKVEEAVDQARANFEHVIVSQVWGETWRVPHECESYSMEMWRMAGYLDRWSDPKMKLVFDKRSPEREARLIRQNVMKNRKPIMLTCLSGGHSGPFSDWQVFQFDLKQRWQKKFQIIDLSGIVAHRIYDLLGLYELADVLVTIDTATLHLSMAVDIPTIALLNDKGDKWIESLLRKQPLVAIPYKRSLMRMEEIHTAIANL